MFRRLFQIICGRRAPSASAIGRRSWWYGTVWAAAVLALTLSYRVEAQGVRFVGQVSYTYVGSLATLKADQVANQRSSGYSGTLQMELWAFSSPYSGAALFGYKLATYRLGQLNAGYSYFNVNSGVVPYGSPPNGTWYYTMVLTEFDGGSINGGYATQNWVSYPTPVVIGPVTPTLIPQSISFPNPGTRTAGSSPFALAASASSGLAVSFASDTPSVCAVSGSVVTLMAVGSCTIRATQSGNTIYALAMAVTQSFTVLAANPVGSVAQRGSIDLDGQGRGAIIVRSSNSQMRAGRLVNNTFQWSSLTDPGPGFSLQAAVDLGGNGRSDLTLLNLSQGDRGDAAVWRDFQNTSPIVLRQVRTLWRVDAAGDLDGDGYGDLVWRFTGNSGNVDDTGVSYIWFTDGTGVTQVRKRGGAPLNWTLLGVMDINGDGAADMIYVSPAGAIRVLMATPGRTCANVSGGAIPSGFTALRFADFTGQRRGDVLVRNDTTGAVQILSLDARGLVLPPFAGSPDDQNASCTANSLQAIQPFYSLGTTNPSWSYYASGDFNGDGVTDVVWQRPDGTLTLWLLTANSGAPLEIANAGTAPVGFTVFQEGGGGGTGRAPSVVAKAEGTYSGRTSNAADFISLILENDQFWTLYGVTDNFGTLRVAGLVQGNGTSNNGVFTASNTKDFYYTGAVTIGTLNASYVPGVSFNGTFSGVTFAGAPPVDTTYSYNSPARLSDITGFWPGEFMDGNLGSLSIASSGTFSGSSSGCSFSGALTPRASGKNVFNVTLTFGAFPCLLPFQSATGVGVWYYIPGFRKQLILAGTDLARTAGSAFFGTR